MLIIESHTVFAMISFVRTNIYQFKSRRKVQSAAQGLITLATYGVGMFDLSC
jgi:hypothetical protein